MATSRRHELTKGSVLRDSYRIKRVLGKGGFAITYLAHHSGLDHAVAIKEYLPDDLALRKENGVTVRPRLGAEQKFKWGLSRFAKEGRMLAKFRHPGIVPITDLFEANGTSYMVMEYVKGESLARVLERGEAPGEADLLAIFDPILDALEEIHATGALHRDIKPANIVVRPNGSAVLLDFGCSRQATDSKKNSLTVALTPGYAPSEQYSSKGQQGPWTDIYALGATIYRAVTGSPPPEAPDRILSDDYVPIARAAAAVYSPALLAAVEQALAIKPADRPQDIHEFRQMMHGRQLEPQTLVPALQESARLGFRDNLKGTDITLTRDSSAPPVAVQAGPADRTSRSKASSGWRQGVLTASLLLALAGAGYLSWADQHKAEAAKLAEATQPRNAERGTDRTVVDRGIGETEIASWLALMEQNRLTRQKELRLVQIRARIKATQAAPRPEKLARGNKIQPYCRDVGGYEAYMKRTNKVCRLY